MKAATRCLGVIALVLTAPAATAQFYDWEPGLLDEIRYRGLLKVGVGMFEPWVMCDANGDLIGFEVDVARKLAEDLEVRIQFVRTDWYYIVPALMEREFDIIVSGMSITPARSLRVNFSRPYSEFGTVIIANASLTRDFRRGDFNRSEVTFAVRSGTTTEALVPREFPGATVLPLDSDAEVLSAVLDGTAHAAAVDQVMATRWLHEYADTLRRAFENLFDRLPQAIAMRKGDADGLNYLDSWVTHHRVNGWFSERWHYWFETRDWLGIVADDPEVLASCDESFEPDPYAPLP